MKITFKKHKIFLTSMGYFIISFIFLIWIIKDFCNSQSSCIGLSAMISYTWARSYYDYKKLEKYFHDILDEINEKKLKDLDK